MRLLFGLCLYIFLSSHAFAASGCSSHDKDYVPIESRYRSGLLFSLRHCRYPTSYVFGTYHSDTPRLKPYVHFAAQALSRTKLAAFELVMDDKTRTEISASMRRSMLAPRLSELLNSQQFNALYQAARAVQPDMSREHLDEFKPWAAAVLLQYPKHEADGKTLDEQLQLAAAHYHIPVFPLETVKEQLSTFDGLSRQKQVRFVQLSLRMVPTLPRLQQQVEAAYMNQDLRRLHQLSDYFFQQMASTADDAQMIGRIQRQLIDERNARMARRMTRGLDRSGFYAVGALHLMGKSGILSILEQRGFRIEAIGQTR